MARPKLKVEKRKLMGRKVKKLRRDGIIPANIYGKDVKSEAVQLELSQFIPVYNEVGETGLVDIIIAKDTKIRPVLVHNVQSDPVTDQLIHIDFHQVNLSEKVTAQIPVELIGESPAVEQKQGILVRTLDEIEVEALPTDLPESIEIDVTKLEKVDDMVKVGQIKLGDKITILADESTIVAKIEPLTKAEEVTPPPVEEGEEVEEGKEAEKAEEGTEQPIKEAVKGEEEAKKDEE